MEKSQYKLNSFIIEIEQNMRKRAFINNLYYDNRYLINENHICPNCQKTIKRNFKNVLSGTGLVGLIFLNSNQKAVSYTVCKKCSKQLAKSTKEEKNEIEKNISSHILITIEGSLGR